MARSLIIGELTQDASADDLSGLSPPRNLRHSINDKIGKLLVTPKSFKREKFVGGEVSPVARNLTDRPDRDKSEELLKVFTDSETNISGEPKIS